MQEKTTVQLKETVTVKKFDHTHEDCPTEPVEVIQQETITEISMEEAKLMGFVPLSEQVEATGKVEMQDSLEVKVEQVEEQP